MDKVPKFTSEREENDPPPTPPVLVIVKLGYVPVTEIPVPLAGASIKIGDYEIGITGPTGYLNTSIPETETNMTASLADYITQELIIEAGIIEINETIALVPAGE